MLGLGFWAGLLVGLWVGVILGVLVAGLSAVARRRPSRTTNGAPPERVLEHPRVVRVPESAGPSIVTPIGYGTFDAKPRIPDQA